MGEAAWLARVRRLELVAATIASEEDWTDTFILTTVPTGAATGDLVVETSKGTSTPVTFTIIQNAPFSPSTVSWTSTNQVPVAVSGHAVAFAEVTGTTTSRVLYVIGGADNTNAPQTNVYHATVGGSGSVSSWTATAALPAAVAFHRAVVATPANSKVSGNGYIYVLGGSTSAAGQAASTIYRGAIGSDGAISAWTTLSVTLPAPLHSFGAAAFLGNLYIWGGATTGNAPVNTAYRSAINGSGDLGAWGSEPALPTKRARFGYGSFGGFLYAFGGDSGAVAPNDGALSNTRLDQVVYARVDPRSRDITSAGWVLNGAGMGKTRAKHTAVVASGNILVTAGLYNGASTGSSEEAYAQLSADGSTGSFNGATGSSTIQAKGGGNVFNHAALGYVDGSGAFHVVVVGGDDVNSPGTKRKTVFYY